MLNTNEKSTRNRVLFSLVFDANQQAGEWFINLEEWHPLRVMQSEGSALVASRLD